MRWPIRYQILLPLAGLMLAVVPDVSMPSAYRAAERPTSRLASSSGRYGRPQYLVDNGVQPIKELI